MLIYRPVYVRVASPSRPSEYFESEGAFFFSALAKTAIGTTADNLALLCCFSTFSVARDVVETP